MDNKKGAVMKTCAFLDLPKAILNKAGKYSLTQSKFMVRNERNENQLEDWNNPKVPPLD
jgi:hypothetical protein